MNLNNNQEAFLALVRAGLWEKQVQLSPYKDINFSEVYRIAEEQSVIGLVAAGLEHVKVPHVWALQFAGQTIQLEQRNKAMNAFIAKFINMLSSFNINVILVKGQGIAQCYERPLWRSCGDVDLLLSDENYNKAKHLLIPKASEVESESLSDKHLGMTIEKWIVELHGSLHTELSSKLDKVVDSVQDEVFYHGCVRTWVNGEVQVFLPSPDNDVIFIFTHYLKHFYKGGLGLRQICDWCRLLWSYGQSLNYGLLESRLRTMGLMTEWKAFAAFAVEYLGMPVEVMPLFDDDKKWARKAKKILEFVMRVGNMGHNRNNSFYYKYPFVIRKIISSSRRIVDAFNHALIFPLDSIRFFPVILFNGVRSAVKGIG